MNEIETNDKYDRRTRSESMSPSRISDEDILGQQYRDSDLKSNNKETILIVTNLPANFTSKNNESLFSFFTRLLEPKLKSRNPLQHCSIDGSKCFLEFRSVEDATNALTNLSAVNICGRIINITRYSSSPLSKTDKVTHSSSYSFSSISTSSGNQNSSQEDFDRARKPLVPFSAFQPAPAPSVSSWKKHVHSYKPKQTPSLDICFGHISTCIVIDDAFTIDEINETLVFRKRISDYKQLANSFGSLSELIAPPCGNAICKLFLKYSCKEDAKKALQKFKSRLIKKRILPVKFFPEDKFNSRELN